jgi:hypothetical protein
MPTVNAAQPPLPRIGLYADPLAIAPAHGCDAVPLLTPVRVQLEIAQQGGRGPLCDVCCGELQMLRGPGAAG